jgi:hypothetical protein
MPQCGQSSVVSWPVTGSRSIHLVDFRGRVGATAVEAAAEFAAHERIAVAGAVFVGGFAIGEGLHFSP